MNTLLSDNSKMVSQIGCLYFVARGVVDGFYAFSAPDPNVMVGPMAMRRWLASKPVNSADLDGDY